MERKNRVILAVFLSSFILGWKEFNEHYIDDNIGCGYNALHDAFYYYGENVDSRDLKKEIIENAGIENIYRDVLSGIYKKFNCIVFPKEIEKTCERHGYVVQRYSEGIEEKIMEIKKNGGSGIVWRISPFFTTHHWEAIHFEDNGYKEYSAYRLYVLERNLAKK